MKSILIIACVFFPSLVVGQIDSVITKLLNSQYIEILVDSSILNVSDTNERDKNGQPHGVWRGRSNEDGRLTHISTYFHGKRHGHSVGIFPNGKIAVSTYHDFDSETGPSLEFWQNGNLRSLRQFKKGKVCGIVKLFDTLGNLKRVFEMRDGHKEGSEIVLYPSGNIQIVTSYSNGQENGARKEYRDSDILDLSAQYYIKNGVLISGLFYENGVLVKTEVYK